MPCVVEADRPLARALARVGRGLVAAARDSLSHVGDDPVLAVHDARRDIRSARAVLRLMRRVLGEEAYREQNEVLGRAARLLSPHRDAHVLAGAFDRLLVGAGDPDPARSPALRGLLAVDSAPDEGSLVMASASALVELERFDAAVESWPRTGDDLGTAIAAGFEHCLRRSRKSARRAEAEPTGPNLHELRKRSKDVRDQLRVLMPRAPGRFARLERRFSRVTDLLGDGRDQLLLAEALGRVGASHVSLAGAAGALREAALARHRGLTERALAASAEAVSTPPRRITRRLHRA